MKFLSIIFLAFSFPQWYSVNHDGLERFYYVSYPQNAQESVSLIINMHGYGGNAVQQMSYAQMDQYAHAQNMAVVYPQGLNNSWNVFTYWDSNFYDDVGFISLMIDQVSIDYSIDLNKVYACGMSNGGYMAYRLACDLSDKIAAFGSVTGNMMINSDLNDCLDMERDVPIIHFHGTADPIVNYYPPTFDQSLTVGESILFWSDYHDFDIENFEILNSNVEKFTYSNNNSSANFVHYKVNGGGHVWFDYSWGFHASEELVNFFSEFKLDDFTIILGDCNNDGLVNIQDVIFGISIILNESSFVPSADLNSDNVNDILDIVIIVDIILN